MKKILGAVSALALLCAVGAQAQSVPPQVPTVGTTDLFQDVVNGFPTSQSQFATAAQISGVLGYSYQIPLTAFSITAGASTALLYLNPAGTLATGTLTFAASPSDGQKFCLLDTQTQTAITLAAGTGNTFAGIANPTALVAGTQYCWFYDKSLAQWIRNI